MRAFERQPKETLKAFEAFKCYRDIGAGRTLRKAAEIYYGSTANLRQMSTWSSKFDWVERTQAFDDWQEMIRNDAIEEFERSKATELVERQHALREKAVSVAEKLAMQMVEMVEWPLARQQQVREAKNGEMAIFNLYPAKWSKRTIRDYFEMVMLATGEPKAPEDNRAVREIIDAINALPEE